MILPQDPLREFLYALALLSMVIATLGLTKITYRLLTKLNLRHNVAVYYNRKIIHMLAGGVTALLVPYLFTSPLIPFLFALLLGFIVYIPHRSKKLMTWFQTSDNIYEVYFCFSWGFSLLIIWLATGNPYYAVVPPLFISFGDAVTGVIRNAVYGRRTKSWIGNLGMLAVTTLIGYLYARYPGLIAGIASTIAEHFEFAPHVDDNILITLVSSCIILVSFTLGFLP
ncbi:MAG: dolichol kinase [Desulfurococcaceae archaeon]